MGKDTRKITKPLLRTLWHGPGNEARVVHVHVTIIECICTRTCNVNVCIASFQKRKSDDQAYTPAKNNVIF